MGSEQATRSQRTTAQAVIRYVRVQAEIRLGPCSVLGQTTTPTSGLVRVWITSHCAAPSVVIDTHYALENLGIR